MIGSIVVTLISYIVAFFLQIVLHEMGHLLAGLATGYKFVSFRLLLFEWAKEDGRIVLKRTRKRYAVGQCLMAPPRDEIRFRFVLYNLGGCLVNLLCGTAAVVVLVFCDWSGYTLQILVGVIAACAYLGFANLIPISYGIPNDGMNIVTAMRSAEAKHGMYLIFAINAALSHGKRFRDFDDTAFRISHEADLTNYLVAYIVILQAQRLYDCAEYVASAAALQQLNESRLPGFYCSVILCARLWNHLIHDGGEQAIKTAREIYGRKGTKKFLGMGLPELYRTHAAAAYYLDNDTSEALALIEKAKTAASNANAGERAMEWDYIAFLEGRMA